MNRSTIDTNILIYSVDPTDGRKHYLANEVVLQTVGRGGSVPLQCLSEFYRACTRKQILAPDAATDVVARILLAATAVPPDADDLQLAMRLHQSDNVQFFDALLLATAARAGCTTLFSEDLQHDCTYGGVTVRNPFLLSAQELESALR